MKKKLRKSKKSAKQPKEGEKPPGVRYLGFVVSSDLAPSGALTHALINLDDAPDTWYVVGLSEDRHEAKRKDVVPRYFHAIFATAVNAVLKSDKDGQLKDNAVVLDKGVEQHKKIASALRQWARWDRVSGGFEGFPKLRMAIHHSLFAAHGTRKPLEVIWRGRVQPDCIFFWKPEKLKDLNLNLLTDTPSKTVTIGELVPESEWAPQSLAHLARSLIVEEYGYSWQDLYKKALLRSMRVCDFIELSATHEDKADRASEQNAPNLPGLANAQVRNPKDAVSILRILQDNHKVLLSGPGGSGKTTTLRHVVWQVATEEPKTGDTLFLPIYVPMKWFGLRPRDSMNRPSLSAYLATCIWETIDTNLTTEEICKCDLFREHPQHGPGPLIRQGLLEAIKQEAEVFFCDEESDFCNIMVLFDGLNEIVQEYREMAERQLAQLLNRVGKAVVTTRPCYLPSAMIGAKEFEICELSDEQIVEYLGRSLKDGEHIFATQIQHDTRLLSMARNPFYLSLIAEGIREDRNADIPQNRAKLIGRFVRRSIDRKRKEELDLPSHVEDSSIFVILPSMAKWSLEYSRQVQRGSQRPFHQSQEFRDLGGTAADIFDLLVLAEKYGLLKSSDLPVLHEAGGYPEFIHDNVRDYFAALYLRALDVSEFVRTFPERFEYFAWDEPLLVFLELSSDEQLFLDVIDLIISKDAILASMCVKYANAIGHDLRLDLASRILQSASYEKAKVAVGSVLDGYIRPLVKSLPVHILSSVPAQFLLDTVENLDYNKSLRPHVWVSIGQTISEDSFSLLQNLWRSLPEKDVANGFGVFYSICKIPTHDAFRMVVDIYKELHSRPENDSGLARFMGSEFLTLVSYPPSLSELVTEFPVETSEKEFHALLTKVKEVTAEDLSLLKTLAFHKNEFLSLEACRLLTKLQGTAAIPTLVDRLHTVPLSFISYQFIRFRILELIRELDSDQFCEIIVNMLTIENGYTSDIELWKMLATTQRKQLLKHYVRCACDKKSREASHICVDQLCAWPNRQEVADVFNAYLNKRTRANDRTSLLGACLGIDEFLKGICTDFDNMYSLVVLGNKSPPPEDSELLLIYNSDPASWHLGEYEKVLRLLPLAIRAVTKVVDANILEKILCIVDWSQPKLLSQSKHEKVLFEVIVQSVYGLTTFIGAHQGHPAVEQFIRSGRLQELLRLLVEEQCRRMSNRHDAFEAVMIRFCESIPKKCIPHLLELTVESYQCFLKELQDGGEMRLDPILNMILTLCRCSDDNLVSELLKDLSNISYREGDEKTRNITTVLIEKIKLLKGRRFLRFYT